MPVVNLITIVESDTINSSNADWLALTDVEKSDHIFNASMYMQAQWYCVDVDWSDPTTLNDDIKRACAYYADADRIGLLFDEMVASDEIYPHGKMVEHTEAAEDGYRETYRWAESGATVIKDPLGRVDMLMKVNSCTDIGSDKVTRV